MPSKAPTLQTIADRAGVSKNTVSCALRADPRIPKKTQERIRQIANEVGYRPNPMVAALMQSLRQAHPVAKSANLGFVHCLDGPDEWRSRSYYLQLFQEAEARANEQGYNLTPIWAGDPEMTPERFTGVLRSRGVLGLVIGPVSTYKRLPVEWQHFASAALGVSLKEPLLHRAATFFAHTIPRAWSELRTLGYRHIGVIFSSRDNLRVDYALEAGCAIQRSQLPKGEILPILRRESLTQEELNDWLLENQVDAIISAYAHHIVSLLENSGRRVPEDIGLVALLSEWEELPGAFIRRDWAAIGSATVDLVIGQLLRNERGIPKKPKTVLIEGEWDPGNLVPLETASSQGNSAP
ncbi:LacI family DNA-binding transcriptional regulator [Cerasicoccus arenae]|uniref:HTH lacI-type domain-containing protein n=1 Tax=Cerasicoccus arenae TaxID=424488 RepID=A0A8J3DIS5_9BACT|nr:LacI family DNA-binding transcriptional regulator [Cerasicoccus arenae]MBK1858830.1 LacI family DNA-binding transcriptional regulator [Cerasicoccus arenae]GHC04348.1 hypothetical protein GCM10007047_21330 [Cerasicoccus arenae]